MKSETNIEMKFIIMRFSNLDRLKDAILNKNSLNRLFPIRRLTLALHLRCLIILRSIKSKAMNLLGLQWLVLTQWVELSIGM